MPRKALSDSRFSSASREGLLKEVLKRAGEQPHKIPVITGPTAAGKSWLALELARQTGGQIVSCDAMQVYRGFDIGTAKASAAEQAEIPHHLIDILDPCEAVTVASYAAMARPLLKELLENGKKPILCGGSVQYISSLLDGLRFPQVEPDAGLRALIGDQVDDRGLEASWELVRSLDTEAASTLAKADRRRIIRFFELYEQTGKTLTELNRESRQKGPDLPYLPFWVDLTSREALYDRINQRLDRMLDQGLVQETAKLMKAFPDYSACPAFRGIGYRELTAFLTGQISLEEARELAARASRRYAKRQQTWLRARRDLHILLLD